MITELTAITDNGQVFLRTAANAVCKHLPEGWEMKLCMENGAAWVELYNKGEIVADLEDTADKTLEEQINDAICYAVGW
jgi:hypothetical protein